MTTTRFTADARFGGAYGCGTPGDQSGEYVRAEVAQALLAACIAMRATMYSPDSEESRLADAAIKKATGN